jgi:hypothetical protein
MTVAIDDTVMIHKNENNEGKICSIRWMKSYLNSSRIRNSISISLI